MITVRFTQALKRFYPDLKPFEMEASKVIDVLNETERRFPGIKAYLVDDQGAVRKHVNVFVDGNMIDDRDSLSDELSNNSEVYFMQALSGG